MEICRKCSTKLKAYQQKYCSNKCQIDFQYEQYIILWKKECAMGGVGIVTKNISHHIKRYLIDLNDEKCSLCRWNKKNPITRKVPLEVDHIDGKAINNRPENLRLVCPNCHALTPHFRNLNKGNGRQWRARKN